MFIGAIFRGHRQIRAFGVFGDGGAIAERALALISTVIGGWQRSRAREIRNIGRKLMGREKRYFDKASSGIRGFNELRCDNDLNTFSNAVRKPIFCRQFEFAG